VPAPDSTRGGRAPPHYTARSPTVLSDANGPALRKTASLRRMEDVPELAPDDGCARRPGSMRTARARAHVPRRTRLRRAPSGARAPERRMR
jgi:hypothetical protein